MRGWASARRRDRARNSRSNTSRVVPRGQTQPQKKRPRSTVIATTTRAGTNAPIQARAESMPAAASRGSSRRKISTGRSSSSGAVAEIRSATNARRKTVWLIRRAVFQLNLDPSFVPRDGPDTVRR
jgi:hypothetical protein